MERRVPIRTLMIAIDATVLADHFIGEAPLRDAAQKLFGEDSDWIAPGLWRFELGNVLWKYVRFGKLTASAADGFMREAERLVVETVNDIRAPEILELAIQRQLTMYDASYVWLARSRGLTLRTRDAEVLRQCPEWASPMPVL